MNEVVYTYLADQAEDLRPEIENLIATGMAEQVSLAKRALGRAYVASMAEGEYPDEDIQKSAQWVSDIEQFIVGIVSKEEEDTFTREYGGEERRIRVRRDNHGRFTRGVSQEERVNPLELSSKKHSPAVAQLLASHKERGIDTEKSPSFEDAKKHQAQWLAANRHVNDILSNFDKGQWKDLDIMLNVQNPKTGNAFQRVIPGNQFKNGSLPEMANWRLDQQLNSVELNAKPGLTDENLRNRVAAFNVLGATNSDTLQQLAMVDPAKLSQLSGSLQRKQPGGRQSRLGGFFERLKHGGAVMEETDALRAYGQMARFVGTLGPEAEKVLSPYVQQAAYRYRGTEKEPDLALASDFNSDMMTAVQRAADSRSPQSEISETIRSAALENKGRPGKNDLVLQAAGHEINNLDRTRGGRFTPDELMLNVRADVAARHLLNTLPTDPFVADLSRKAGNILPSQGVIIDADGDVVTQAVGFGDDHYLPFDFKNLRALHGGQYIRTRQQGGLTGEDIYTAARTNARMATVVSSSGVYSLEFDPNFRGARASTDRAKQMYDRYLHILDAVDKSGLYVRDLDPAEKEKVTVRARLVAEQTNQDPKEITRTMLEAAREKNLSELDYVGIQAEAEKQVAEEGRNYSEDRRSRRVEDVYNELVSAEREKRVSRLSLNAKGYSLALQTLQQQFPYFIRNVSYQPLTSKNEGEGFLQSLNDSGAAGARQRLGAEDKGYASPGGLRARSVKGGYYEVAPTEMPMKPAKTYGQYGSVVTGGEEPKTTTNSANAKITQTVKPNSATGGLMSAIAQQNVGAVAEFKPEIKQFQMDMTGIGLGALPAGVDGFDNSWEDSKNDSLAIIRYVINPANSANLPKIINESPEEVANALSDREAVTSQITLAYGNIFSELEELPGFESIEDLIERVVGFGNDLRAVNNSAEPFVEPQPEGAYYDGDRPQLFKEFANAKTTTDVDDAIADNAIAQEHVQSLLDGEQDIADIEESTKEHIATLSALKAAYPEYIAGHHLADPDKMNLRGLAAKAGVTKDELATAFYPQEYDLDSPLDEIRFGIPSIDAQANAHQQAWSAATAYHYLLEAGGGEPAPKAEPPVDWEVDKQYSSRQVRVVSKSHPLAQKIQERRRKGLPLL
jgi:hypothetical protein